MKTKSIWTKFLFVLFALPLAVLLIASGCGQNGSGDKSSWPSDLPYHQEGLDYYTIPELKTIANWLSDNCSKDGFEDSIVYQTFNNYKSQGQIWFSNSNGQILCSVSDIGKAADPSKCNQDYKLDFGSNVRDIDRFLFLRIVGICEDEKTGGGKAGLTFSVVSALPVGSEYGQPNSWWGNSTVRSALQEGGTLYKYLSTANGIYTSNITKVNKYSQETRKPALGSEPERKLTEDMFFLPSTSETFPLKNVNADIKYLQDGGEGNQYSYFKQGNLDLTPNNKDSSNSFMPTYYMNSRNKVSNATTNEWKDWISRSVYTDKSYYSSPTSDSKDLLNIGIFVFDSSQSFSHNKLGSEVRVSIHTDEMTFGTPYVFPVAPMFCF